MIIALTGHRPQRLNNEWNLNGPCCKFVKQELQKIIDEKKPNKIISGMALGSDTMWAMLGIENDIAVIAAIPCSDHGEKWPKFIKKQYKELIQHPLIEKVIVSKGSYTPEKMVIRDMYMVDLCDLLVAVYDNTPHGGTYHTIKYAQSEGKPIIFINPNEYKLN